MLNALGLMQRQYQESNTSLLVVKQVPYPQGCRDCLKINYVKFLCYEIFTSVQ